VRQLSRISLRDILYIIFRDKNRILLITLTAFIGSYVYVMLQSSIYVAESQVLVRVGKEKLAGLESYTKDNYNILFQERGQDIHNGLEILKDKQLAMKVLEKLRPILEAEGPPLSLWGRVKSGAKTVFRTLKSWLHEPLYWFNFRHRISEEAMMLEVIQGALSAEAIEDTDIIRVSFGWTDPEFAALTANEFANQFVSRYISIHRNPNSESFYREQIKSYMQVLEDADTELSNFRISSNIANISLEKEILLNAVSEIEADHRDLSIKLEEDRSLRELITLASQNGEWAQTPSLDGGITADLAELDRQYLELVGQQAQLSVIFEPGAREIKQLTTRMERLRRQKVENLSAYFTLNISSNIDKKALLEKQLSDNKSRLNDLTRYTGRLEQLVRLRNLAQENYLVYSQKAEELRISDALTNQEISGIRVVSNAVAPAKPAYPRINLIVGLATIFGLFLGVGFSTITEYFNQTFREASDVERILGVPLLMTVPKL